MGAENEQRETEKVSLRNLPSSGVLCKKEKPRFGGVFLCASSLVTRLRVQGRLV
jgi:hypothetical protein